MWTQPTGGGTSAGQVVLVPVRKHVEPGGGSGGGGGSGARF